MSKNPLELIHDTFWTLLLNNAAFIDVVDKEKNRILVYGGKAQPIKPEIGPADLPEVRIVPAIIDANPYSDSETTSLRVHLAVQVATGHQEISRLLKIQWAVFCSLLNWDTVLETLTWNGLPFVSACRLHENKDSLHNDELNRGIKGWSSIWQCEIDCHWKTATLRNWEGT